MDQASTAVADGVAPADRHDRTGLGRDAAPDHEVDRPAAPPADAPEGSRSTDDKARFTFRGEPKPAVTVPDAPPIGPVW